MSRHLINRYLTREILAPFVFCLLVFTVVLLAGRLVPLAELVISKGVALADVLHLLATMLPPLLVIIVPLAFLMGIMIGFGRLSADCETIALKATGNGLLDMARPVWVLAGACAVVTLLFSVWLAPQAKRAFRATLFEITSRQASVSLQKQVFLKQFSNLVLYANDLDERSGEMSGVCIVEQQPEGPTLILAESGQVHSDRDRQSVTLQLRNGVIHRQAANEGENGYQTIGFTVYEIIPNLSKSLATVKKPKQKRSELDITELRAIAAGSDDQAWEAKTELHRRLCATLAPPLFALFALPFSTFSQRSGRNGGFILGLIIYLAYYILTSVADTLTNDLKITPLVSFWALHLLMFVAGGYLLRQSSLERPGTLVVWADRCLATARRLTKSHAHS